MRRNHINDVDFKIKIGVMGLGEDKLAMKVADDCSRLAPPSNIEMVSGKKVQTTVFALPALQGTTTLTGDQLPDLYVLCVDAANPLDKKLLQSTLQRVAAAKKNPHDTIHILLTNIGGTKQVITSKQVEEAIQRESNVTLHALNVEKNNVSDWIKLLVRPHLALKNSPSLKQESTQVASVAASSLLRSELPEKIMAEFESLRISLKGKLRVDYYGNEEHKQYEALFARIEILALGNNPHAQYLLANTYRNDQGNFNNPKEFIRWMTASAKNKYPMAMYHMGILLTEGKPYSFLVKNTKEAAKYFAAVYSSEDIGAKSAVSRYLSNTADNDIRAVNAEVKRLRLQRQDEPVSSASAAAAAASASSSALPVAREIVRHDYQLKVNVVGDLLLLSGTEPVSMNFSIDGFKVKCVATRAAIDMQQWDNKQASLKTADATVICIDAAQDAFESVSSKLVPIIKKVNQHSRTPSIYLLLINTDQVQKYKADMYIKMLSEIPEDICGIMATGSNPDKMTQVFEQVSEAVVRQRQAKVSVDIDAAAAAAVNSRINAMCEDIANENLNIDDFFEAAKREIPADRLRQALELRVERMVAQINKVDSQSPNFNFGWAHRMWQSIFLEENILKTQVNRPDVDAVESHASGWDKVVNVFQQKALEIAKHELSNPKLDIDDFKGKQHSIYLHIFEVPISFSAPSLQGSSSGRRLSPSLFFPAPAQKTSSQRTPLQQYQDLSAKILTPARWSR